MTGPLANHAALDDFAALDPGQICLLLDFDGTLVDIAPSPDAVHVPEALCDALARLLPALGGALALVSGRPIADLDRRFLPLKLPIVGGHGAEMRVREGKIVSTVAPLRESLRRQLAEAQNLDPGIVVEDKGYSLALHYRKAPQCEEALRRHIDRVLAASPSEAVRMLMDHAPFAGRRPVFIGDDVTDESVFAALPDLGGKGYSVGRHFAGVTCVFDKPDDVRAALRRLADKARPRDA